MDEAKKISSIISECENLKSASERMAFESNVNMAVDNFLKYRRDGQKAFRRAIDVVSSVSSSNLKNGMIASFGRSVSESISIPGPFRAAVMENVVNRLAHAVGAKSLSEETGDVPVENVYVLKKVYQITRTMSDINHIVDQTVIYSSDGNAVEPKEFETMRGLLRFVRGVSGTDGMNEENYEFSEGSEPHLMATLHLFPDNYYGLKAFGPGGRYSDYLFTPDGQPKSDKQIETLPYVEIIVDAIKKNVKNGDMMLEPSDFSGTNVKIL
jgi:hypothetical protein